MFFFLNFFFYFPHRYCFSRLQRFHQCQNYLQFCKHLPSFLYPAHSLTSSLHPTYLISVHHQPSHLLSISILLHTVSPSDPPPLRHPAIHTGQRYYSLPESIEDSNADNEQDAGDGVARYGHVQDHLIVLAGKQEKN